MESLLLRENGGMNAGRSSFAFLSNNSIVGSSNNNIDGGFGFGFGFGSVNYPLHHPLCLTQSLFDANNINCNFGGSFISTARPLYSSLPPVRVQRQPPLLPLPIKSATLPSSNIKIGSSAHIIRSSSSSSAARQNKRKKKNQQAKLSTIPKERATVEIAKIAAPPKPAKRNDPPAEEEEEDTEEEFLLVGSRAPSSPLVYSRSPPPSSVPLPKLLLMRPRPAKSAAAASARSCIAEAVAGGMDLGATDDICRLLRI